MSPQDSLPKGIGDLNHLCVGGAGSHGVAMGCEEGAPLGRIRCGGAGSHGVAMGCEEGAPLGRIRVGARVPTASPWAAKRVPR